MKHRTNVTKGITPVLPKGDMIYPLKQSNEIPAIPIVEVGEVVSKGQKIAEASSITTVPVYATVSGRVKSVSNSIASSKWEDNCIVIENDGEYREVEYEAVSNVEECSSKDILKRIANSGIVYEPETGLSLRAKLSVSEPEKITYIVMNLPKMEECLTGKDYKAEQHFQEIIEGMKQVLRLFENAKGVFAIEKSRKECIKKYKTLLKSESRIELKTYKNTLDSAWDDQECISLDADMLVGIHDAVFYGMPLAEKIVTIIREGENNCENVKVLLGTNLKHLLESVGNVTEENFNMDVPITQATSEILRVKMEPLEEKEISVEGVLETKEIQHAIWYLIACLPMLLFGVYKYNMEAVIVLFCSVWTAIVIEGFWNLFTQKSIMANYRNALAIGVLFGLNLPAKAGWWVCVIGVAIAMVAMKLLWDKKENQLVFLALGARCIVSALFYKNTAIHVQEIENVFDLYVGNAESILGGLSIVFVLIGLVVLLLKGMVDIGIQGMYLVCLILSLIVCNRSIDPHILALNLCNGALMFWGLLMTNDYRNMLSTKVGKICCGLLIGILSAIAVSFGFLEAVPFIVLLVGLIIRIIEHMVAKQMFVC